MESLLTKISEEAYSQNIIPIFALAPSIFQVNKALWSELLVPKYDQNQNYDKSYPNKRMTTFANENNLFMIDLLPTLNSAYDEGYILYNKKEQHWTEKGNEIVAYTLQSFIDSISTKSSNFRLENIN